MIVLLVGGLAAQPAAAQRRDQGTDLPRSLRGFSGIEVNRDSLASVTARLGHVETWGTGDAGTARAWWCYRTMSGGDSAMLLISSDGEMGGGPGNEVDEIRLIRSPDGDSAAYSWSMRHFLTPEEPEYKYWNERRTECFEGRPPYQDISARVVVWFDERGAYEILLARYDEGMCRSESSRLAPARRASYGGSMSVSRRDWLKTIGAVGVGAMAPLDFDLGSTPSPPLAPERHYAPGDIVELSSTSDVFTPARGRTWMKFSFDFPEPAVVFGDHRFSFLVFSDENTYALDRARMHASGNADALELTCDGLTWAGGQEHAPGKVAARFSRNGSTIEWHVVVEMERPVKSVTTVIRDVPRGMVSLGGGPLVDTKEGDALGAYPFGGGDLHNFENTSMSTPVAVVQTADQSFLYLTTLDAHVRPKRYYFQAGERAFRVEAVYEHDAWRDDKRVEVPGWRLGQTTSLEAAIAAHMEHIERAFALPAWETRSDVQPWMRRIALVTTLHGMHYTGFIFNDYARQLEILRWMATQISPDRVLVFLSSWDGRYYWDYPNYTVPARMGGDAGFRRLISEARRLGFKMMPMFGTNAANRKQPVWSSIASGATYKIDGDLYNINWVDWNNDRHQDAWLTYMNLGADAWRNHLEGRIAEMIERYGVDAYFLDIVGGHVNSTTGDMHEGTRRLVENLRARFPAVACVGEMPYDALHGFIPMYHAGNGARWHKYSRFFQHLSAPAAGRGSSGVHEWGFSRFNTETLGLSPAAIPTLQVVDDTFTKYRDVMAGIIARAKSRALV